LEGGIDMALPKITADEFFEAIRDGVRQAITDLVRNGTDMPAHDFFDAIKEGVESALVPMVDHGPEFIFFDKVKEGIREAARDAMGPKE
jgi:hypothetical protein